jgi:hypothetical protein
MTDLLSTRLQEHLKILNRVETSKPSAVIDCDQAKTRTDKLVEILRVTRFTILLNPNKKIRQK